MMSSFLHRSVLARSIGIFQRAVPKRNLSQVIDLRPDELESSASPPTTEFPAKYPFKKLDFNSTTMSQVMMKVKSKKMRENYQLMMLEGRRLIQEAFDAGCSCESLFFSRHDDLNLLNLPDQSVTVFKTPYKEMKLWSHLTTPPGLIGIFKIPNPIPETRASLPLTVICDQLREPGNLGAMIRNCAGVGVRRVILTPGCTDLWDGKVLRGGAGAHFKIRIRPDVSWEEIEALVSAEQSQLLLATTHHTDDSGSIQNLLPISLYYQMNFTLKHNFLVIGGETEGISPEAYGIAARTEGRRVTIPLANGVESLNSVAAASVIMFEVKKQISLALAEG